jgi:hypothetical protein
MPPKARRTDIIAMEFEGGFVLYDELTQRVHELNASAASVWQHSDGSTSIEALTAAVAADTELPADEAIVHLALAQLGKAGLLDGPQAPFDARISRRQISQRLGLTGSLALLLPIVSSIVAPTPVMAQSGGTPAPGTPAPTFSPVSAPTSAPTPALPMDDTAPPDDI